MRIMVFDNYHRCPVPLVLGSIAAPAPTQNRLNITSPTAVYILVPRVQIKTPLGVDGGQVEITTVATGNMTVFNMGKKHGNTDHW